MELWVRSQNKSRLIQVKYVYIDETDFRNSGSCRIKTYDTTIGVYKTKERALEVLDEIQTLLHPTLFLSAEINTNDNNWVENGIMYQKYKDSYSIQELSTYVYEMPKE